jgi:hypothetical protein
MANKPLVEKWQGRVSHEHGNSKIHEACVAKDRQVVLEGLCYMISDLLEGGDPLDRQNAMNRAGRKGLGGTDAILKAIRDADKPKEDPMDAIRKRRAEKKAKLQNPKSINKGEIEKRKEENNEEFIGVPSKIRQEWAEAYTSIYEKKLAAPDHDPVGQEDKDIDNDGDHDKTDKYLLNRRRVIGKAISKKSKKDVDESVLDMTNSAGGKVGSDSFPKGKMMGSSGRESDGAINANRARVDTLIKKKAKKLGLKKYEGPDRTKTNPKFIKLPSEVNAKFSKEELERIEAIVDSWEEATDYEKEVNKAATKELSKMGWKGNNDDPVITKLKPGKAKGGFGVGARKRQGAGRPSDSNVANRAGVRFQ